MLCGDSTQIVHDFSDGLFDHLIADPPYTAHVHDRLTTNDGKGHVKRVRATFASIGVADLAMVPDFLRVVKRWSLFFCALEQLGEYRQAAPDRWLRSGIYRKERATPQLSGDRPGNSCEGIAIFHAKGRKRWNRGGRHPRSGDLFGPFRRELARAAHARGSEKGAGGGRRAPRNYRAAQLGRAVSFVFVGAPGDRARCDA